MKQEKQQRRTRALRVDEAIRILSKIVGIPQNDSDCILSYAILIAIEERCLKLERPAFSGLTLRQYVYLEKTLHDEIVRIVRDVGAFKYLSIKDGKRRLLIHLLRLLTRGAGRPRRQGGLINISTRLSKRPSGRPLIIPLDQEYEWVKRGMGTKMALWAIKEGIYSLPFKRILRAIETSGGLDALNTIPDAEALRSMEENGWNPPAKSFESLRKRFSNAKRGYCLPR